MASVTRFRILCSNLHRFGGSVQYSSCRRRICKQFILLRQQQQQQQSFTTTTQSYNESGNNNDIGVSGENEKLLGMFIDPEVQSILYRITGLDLEKIFKPRKERLKPPTTKVMTDKQLEEAFDTAREEARKRLQMPPVLPEREERGRVLSEDDEIEGLLSCNMVFTDISPGLGHRERLVTVREPSGRLREATCDEHDRAVQVYFARQYRKIGSPEIFHDEFLKIAMRSDHHEHILDRACVQFEPDSRDFIDVHHTVYTDIDSKGLYDSLRSTRHFGGLAFYLVRLKQCDGLLVDMLQRSLFQDAVDFIRLHHLLHGGGSSHTTDSVEAVREFAKTHSRQGGLIERALQVYLENSADGQDGRAEVTSN